ncbi:MAG: diguanylate cyclase [Syntrophomonadaceae bacterium]|nr:diguanylate cyclase [Syntrophomonadaceae bacterium]
MPLLQLLFTAVPLIALMSYCLLLLFFTLSQKDKYIRMFMAVLVALIVWTAPGVLMQVQFYPGVLFWHRIMIAGMAATPFLLFLFVSVYTASINIYSIVFWGLVAVGSIVTDLLGYVIVDSTVVNYDIIVNGHHFNGVEFIYTVSPMANLLFLFIFIMILAIIVKAWKSVKSGNVLYDQIGLIIVGISIMFIGTLLNAAGMHKYPIAILASLVNAILMIIAIYKYRMLELRFMLTRGIVYSILAALITTAYVYCVLYIQNTAGNVYQNALPYFTIFTALLVALVFQPLFRFTNKLVDKMFYRAEYSQRQALRNFSTVISNNLDLNNIAQELIEAVQLAIRSNQVLILTKHENDEHYYVFQTSSKIFKPDLRLANDNPVVAWFLADHNSLSRDELSSLPFFKSMWEKEKREIYDLGIEVIIPIKSRSELIGMLMMTRKQNNTAYTLDDLDLLSYLGASTAVAFDNARLFTRSQNEALTDSLTKLHNHRYFFKSLNEQMTSIGSSELSLLMIDLDLFKLFNDLYGHVEGDKALEMVASILVRNVGQKGVVCRYGGEEFTVLLPYYDTKMAFDIAEKIRLDIERSFFNMNDVTQRFLTASIGVCTYPHAAPNAEELLKRADLAMYTAKNSGKNQTVIYTPEVISIDSAYGDSDDRTSTKPTFAATIYALTAAIDAKDHYTFGHSQKVAQYATSLASKLALDKSHVEIIREAALLHDIGKIGIPESILTKTGRLTNEEFEVVKQHVEMSITIIKHLPSMNHVIPAVIGHHERWDGKGYPRGLKGENIPLAARCLAITDAFDAMTSSRPYRSSLSVNTALNEIEKNMGTQFDPLIANIFIKLVRDGSIKVNQDAPSVKIVS